MPKSNPKPVGRCPVERILLCELFTRRQRGKRSHSTSMPGHLLQLTIAGSCEHHISGRQTLIRKGTLVWFHEDETVQTHIYTAPWVYYSVNFIAPSLEPPPYSDRIQHDALAMQSLFHQLHEKWAGAAQSKLQRDLAVHSALSDLLSRITFTMDSYDTDDLATDLWWRIESQFRRDLTAIHTLRDMEKLTDKSQATIARACRRVHKQSPIRRLKEIRLSMARGLVRHSLMRINEIADQVGYARQHELARDYRKRFGVSPTRDRTGQM